MKFELTLEIASDDAQDKYSFTTEESSKQVAFDWTLAEAKDTGKITVSKKAMESAGSVFWIDQGSVASVDADGAMSSHKNTDTLDALPAFLLSRKAYKQLVAGKSIHVHALWGNGEPSTRTTSGKEFIKVRGKKQQVPVLHVEAGDVTLAVLRSLDWPLVLVRKESGDNGITLLSLSELPPLDEAPLAGSSGDKKSGDKKGAAKADKPLSDVDKLITLFNDKSKRREASDALEQRLREADISGEIVDGLLRSGALDLPPRKDWDPKEASQLDAKAHLLFVLLGLLSIRPGKRGEALMRSLCVEHPNPSTRDMAAAKLISAMREEVLPQDEAWLKGQADVIDSAEEECFRTAASAGELLGPQYFFDRFAPYLEAKRLKAPVGVARAEAILYSIGDGFGVDKRWKSVLTLLKSHKEIGAGAKKALSR